MKTNPAKLVVAALVGWLTTANPASTQTWTAVMTPARYVSFNSWSSVASSADGNHLVVAATNGPILTSTNSGSDWTAATVPAMHWSSVAESASGNIIAAAALNGPIYLSTDFGTTWAQTRAPSNNWTSVTLSADGSRMIAAATNGPIYLSTDAGGTWTGVEVPNTNGYDGTAYTNHWSAVASSADGSKLFALSDPGYSTVWGYLGYSTNFGSSWIFGWQEMGYDRSIACSADGNRAAVAFARWVLTWTNGFPVGIALGGWNWVIADTNYYNGITPQYTNYMATVASSADGSKLVAAEAYGWIFTSTNFGATWIRANAPNLPWSSVATSADGSKMIAVSSDGGIFLSGTIPQPKVGIAVSGGNNVLWWPWPASGFVLQQNSDLSTTNWTDVTNPPVLVNQVILPVSGSNVFYRLKSL